MTFTLSLFHLFTFLLFHNNLPRRAVGEADDVDTFLHLVNLTALDIIASDLCHFLRFNNLFNAVGVAGCAERLLFAIEGFTVCCLDKCHKVVLCIIVEVFQRCRHHIARSQHLSCIGRYANILFITLSTLSAH